MPKQKLTNTFLKRVPIPKTKSKVLYTDIVNKDLCLEVKANSSKTFFYRYIDNKKTKYVKVGSFPSTKVDDARTKVEELKNSLLTKQVNTTVIDTSSLTPSITLGEFYEKYYLAYIKTSKKSYKEDMSFYNNHILPLYKDTPMNQINRANITQLHIQLIQVKNLKPSTANKLIKYLSHTYNLAISWSIPNVTVNPTKFIKLFVEDNLVERYLNKEEIQRLLKIAKRNSNPYVLPLIQFLLLTGARKSEVLNAKWCDIDLINDIFTIPLSKSNKIRRVPISKKLKSILETLPKYDTYVFPSLHTKDAPMKNFEFHWYRIRKEANLEDVRIHDLRHTYASTLVNAGVSLYVVQKLLGHSDISITQRYAHLNNDSLYDATSLAETLI